MDERAAYPAPTGPRRDDQHRELRDVVGDVARRPHAQHADGEADPELVGEVLAVIQALACEGTTMIVVTHEMGFAREVSDRVMFLHNGLIEEEGPPEAMFGAPKSERFRQFISKHLR